MILTVTDNDGLTDKDTTTADIHSPPVADADGPYTGVVNEPVQFDGSGSNDPDGRIVRYRWDFGDGSTAEGDTLIHPTHSYADTGTYQVVLTVTDDDTATAKDTTSVTIEKKTGVEVSYLSDVPDKFGLSQNYPNPFNPGTVIEYQLPEPCKVTIKIFNLLGQEIRTLADGEKQAGYFTAHWDGKDNFGREVANGIYIYRTEAHTDKQRSFVNAKKMLFLR